LLSGELEVAVHGFALGNSGYLPRYEPNVSGYLLSSYYPCNVLGSSVGYSH